MSRITSEKKVYFFIRLKSKENISAISARKKFQIDEELVVIGQYRKKIQFYYAEIGGGERKSSVDH